VRIPEHRDHRFRPNVIRDSGIPIADSGDSDRWFRDRDQPFRDPDQGFRASWSPIPAIVITRR